jgi:thiol-disulfide isomerase/thioredoxin
MRIPLLLMLVPFVLAGAPTPAGAQAVIGEPPPDAVGTLDGRPVRVSDYRGRVVVVTFWASWCAPCLQELPVLDNLQRRVGEDRLKVIGVNLREPMRLFRRIQSRLKDAAITLTHDADGSIAGRFGVRSVPHMFMIDHAGDVAYIHKGYAESMLGEFVEQINGLLREQAAAAR